jgi:protein-disulfide isomerase
MPPWVPVAGIGAVAVLIVVAIIVANSTLNADSDVKIPERTISSEGRTIGSPDAPVTMVEYADFQCPYCARAAATTTPQIEDEYVADGRVKIMYHYMAFEGPESVLAAEAAECANDQGRFWDYYDTLYENQVQYSVEDLRGFAEDLGLDMATFNQCLDSGEHEQLVAAETQEALDDGINSTPTFVIGDQVVTGAQPIDVFRQVIEEELSKAQ